MFFRNHDDFNVIMIYLYHFIAEDLNPSIIKVLFWQSIVDKVWIILGYFVDLLCRRSVGEACASSQKVLYPARFSADNSSLLKKKSDSDYWKLSSFKKMMRNIKVMNE